MTNIYTSLCFCLIGNVIMGQFLPSPRIIRHPNEEDDPVIDAGENYTIICEGSQPLKWIYPQPSSQETRAWTVFELTTYNNSEEGFNKHRSELNIYNMSYPFVGYYTCQEETGDEQDRIYLYVNDTDHLSVEDKYTLHYAVQYKETTIPCRPTAPDIEVQLITYSSYPSINYVYSPKTGFTFNISHNTPEDIYYCIFHSRNQSFTIEYSIYLAVSSARAFLALPYLEDMSNNHTDVGQTLNLTCSLQESSHQLNFIWRTPRGSFRHKGRAMGVEVKLQEFREIKGKDFLYSNLIIKNSTIGDSGTYTCEVSDRQGNIERTRASIVVHSTDNCYIEIWEKNLQKNITVNAGQKAQWVLDVIGHPIPELTWYDNRGNLVKNNTSYHTEFSHGKALFKIENTLLESAGVYKLRGVSQRDYSTKNCPKQAEYEVSLTVNDIPTVCLSTSEENCKTSSNLEPIIYQTNEEAYVECIATGYPLPKITWQEKTCFYNICEVAQVETENTIPSEETYKTYARHKINTTREGTIKCVASNELGRSESTINYYISDIEKGFDLLDFGQGYILKRDGTTTEALAAERETFTFTCGVSPKKSGYLQVFFNDEPLNERHDMETVSSELSKKTTVSLRNIHLLDSGRYSCKIRNLYDNSNEYRNVTLTVKEPEEPKILETNLDREVLIDYPKMKKDLICHVAGLPKPQIEWFKGHKLIYPSQRIFLKNNDMILHFNYTELEDEGVYRCEASNAAGSTFKEASLRFKVKPVSVAIYLYATGFVAILLVIALIYIFVRVRKERQLLRDLKALGLENFHKGSPENLNPELGIDDQADLLPYNKKFEFPIEHLTIGKQLGSGAFGVVMKGEAKAIIPGEPKTTVAVKMVKKNADQTYIKALASELKVMVHLGKHINVVNLLGACTKNVAKRELLVIVEFCRYGNLQNYIYKHRETYINQVDPITGNVDYYIGADILEMSPSLSSENCSSPVRQNSMFDYRERNNTLSTQLSCTGEESVLMSNNSAQPEWRFNYKGDYRGDVKPICTRDLLTYAFQVARGMEYLASRKVLHGDLAARNILLADNNVVKICDFGLAKTMYTDNNYKKKGNSPLPIKWMAIESIRDRIFSTQSDVWSFGIVLWEFFSLARTPYPGMEADERLYHKLLEGYRMDSPKYSPREAYKIMLECWNSKPLGRPSFTKLAEKIGVLLEDIVRKHYVDLNDPYLKMNTEKLDTDDYLAMLNTPSFDVLSTPSTHYANDEIIAENSQPPEGYLHMGAKQIFSPRIKSNNIFTFQVEKNKFEAHELDPMLENNTGYLMPVVPPNSISNPEYYQMPEIRKENLLSNADNYISMPHYKNLGNGHSNLRDSGIGSPVQSELDKGSNVYYVNKYNADIC